MNQKLSPKHKGLYYQVIHDHVQIFGLDLRDIATPASFPPFHITTFGPPSYKPPIRASPPHATILRE